MIDPNADESTVATAVGGVAEPRSAPRPKFARLSRDPQRAVRQMAARIKFLIEFFSEDGRSMRMQEVKRGLHAYRYLEFDDAVKLLEKRKQVVIQRVPSRSRPVFRVALKQNSRPLPDPYVFHRKKKRKNRKKPSSWFLEHRHFFDRGIHTGFAQITPWQESAYWLEQERMQEEKTQAEKVQDDQREIS